MLLERYEALLQHLQPIVKPSGQTLISIPNFVAFVKVALLLPEALSILVSPGFCPVSPCQRTLPMVRDKPQHCTAGTFTQPNWPVCLARKSNQFFSPLYFPAGFELLYQPEVVRLYLSLLTESQNYNTLEAAAGALQNLSAGQWTVSPGLGRVQHINTMSCLTFRFLFSYIAFLQRLPSSLTFQ